MEKEIVFDKKKNKTKNIVNNSEKKTFIKKKNINKNINDNYTQYTNDNRQNDINFNRVMPISNLAMRIFNPEYTHSTYNDENQHNTSSTHNNKGYNDNTADFFNEIYKKFFNTQYADFFNAKYANFSNENTCDIYVQILNDYMQLLHSLFSNQDIFNNLDKYLMKDNVLNSFKNDEQKEFYIKCVKHFFNAIQKINYVLIKENKIYDFQQRIMKKINEIQMKYIQKNFQNIFSVGNADIFKQDEMKSDHFNFYKNEDFMDCFNKIYTKHWRKQYLNKYRNSCVNKNNTVSGYFNGYASQNSMYKNSLHMYYLSKNSFGANNLSKKFFGTNNFNINNLINLNSHNFQNILNQFCINTHNNNYIQQLQNAFNPYNNSCVNSNLNWLNQDLHYITGQGVSENSLTNMFHNNISHNPLLNGFTQNHFLMQFQKDHRNMFDQIFNNVNQYNQVFINHVKECNKIFLNNMISLNKTFFSNMQSMMENVYNKNDLCSGGNNKDFYKTNMSACNDLDENLNNKSIWQKNIEKTQELYFNNANQLYNATQYITNNLIQTQKQQQIQQPLYQSIIDEKKTHFDEKNSNNTNDFKKQNEANNDQECDVFNDVFLKYINFINENFIKFFENIKNNNAMKNVFTNDQYFLFLDFISEVYTMLYNEIYNLYTFVDVSETQSMDASASSFFKDFQAFATEPMKAWKGVFGNASESADVKVDYMTKQNALFFIKQLFNAYSPNNFIFLNKEVLKKAFETNGDNFKHGSRFFQKDLKNGYLNSVLNEDFVLGKDVASTKGKVIFKNNIIELIQYIPVQSDVFKTPLLLIPPFVNKYYILDLDEKNSMVKWMLDQGHNVFLISWVNANKTHENISIESYIQDGVLKALEMIYKITGEKNIHGCGYCVSGTLLGIAASYINKKYENYKKISKKTTVDMDDENFVFNNGINFKTLTFLTTCFDFSRAGEMKIYTQAPFKSFIYKELENKKIIHWKFLSKVFNTLKSKETIWREYVNTYLLGNYPMKTSLSIWSAQPISIPAKVERFVIDKLYNDNILINSNDKLSLKIKNETISLKNLYQPIYMFGTTKDHLIPIDAIFDSFKCLISGNIKKFNEQVRIIIGDAGHVVGVINPPNKNKYSFYYGELDNINQTSLQWLEQSKSKSGSWWTDWNQWLQNKSDNKKVKSKVIKNSIYDAPGMFIFNNE